MTERSQDLQSFVEACSRAYTQFAPEVEGRRSVGEIFRMLERPLAQAPVDRSGSRLPACEHLEAALSVDLQHDSLRALIAAFRKVEPLLVWRTRPTYDKATASENFMDGHANAMILGPDGLEERSDVWLGVTLMAPNVRYPDHSHTPEEVYLVLSEGDFLQGDRGWFTPGMGGSFYNVPHIRHAMRSGDRPLFAFWALRVPVIEDAA